MGRGGGGCAETVALSGPDNAGGRGGEAGVAVLPLTEGGAGGGAMEDDDAETAAAVEEVAGALHSKGTIGTKCALNWELLQRESCQYKEGVPKE